MELSQINNRIFFLHQYSPYFLFKKFDIVKWTVSVILSDPLCKDGNVRFTTIPLEALSDHVGIRYPCFGFKTVYFLFLVSPQKRLNHAEKW